MHHMLGRTPSLTFTVIMVMSSGILRRGQGAALAFRSSSSSASAGFSSRSVAVHRPLVGRFSAEAVAVSSASASTSIITSGSHSPNLFSSTRLFQSTASQSTESTGSTESGINSNVNSNISMNISIAPRIKTADAVTAAAVADHNGSPVTIKGWVRTLRKQKTLAFVEVNDGSSLAGIQCVISFDQVDATTLTELDQVTTGCAVEVTGPLVASQGKQAVEVQASQLRVVGLCPANTYPLAKKRHSLEYLRSIAHLRPRTNTVAAVARVRSQLAGAIHAFFQQSGFVYVQTPLITASDCEGAGELFRVTTLDLDHVSKLPMLMKESSGAGEEQDGGGGGSGSPQPTDQVDYKKDFFGKPAYLTVSGQLGAETHACALGDVYTFGPTFRAENSQTSRHLAEFHMLEPEMAFADLDSAMNNAEQMLKFVVAHVLQNSVEDLEFFRGFYDKGLQERLQKLVQQPFVRISYREAVAILQEEIAKDPTVWQFPDVEFGTDLATEHERWLAETKFESAVFVYNYPKAIKAFYMRDNDEDGGETVNAMDLLVPGVGELVGGSQREERLDVLEQKISDLGLNKEDYWWYLDLRRFGSVPHAGYGLGFERLVCYVCGIENIREAIAFPRYPGNAEF